MILYCPAGIVVMVQGEEIVCHLQQCVCVPLQVSGSDTAAVSVVQVHQADVATPKLCSFSIVPGQCFFIEVSVSFQYVVSFL